MRDPRVRAVWTVGIFLALLATTVTLFLL